MNTTHNSLYKNYFNIKTDRKINVIQYSVPQNFDAWVHYKVRRGDVL